MLPSVVPHLILDVVVDGDDDPASLLQVSPVQGHLAGDAQLRGERNGLGTSDIGGEDSRRLLLERLNIGKTFRKGL